MNDASNSVAVTGIGIVSALGHDVNSFWNSCLEGYSAIEPIPKHWAQYYESKSRYWSPLPLPDFISIGLRRSDLLSYDPASLNTLYAAHHALAHARHSVSSIDERGGRYRVIDVDRDRCGVFIGTGLGCITSAFQNYLPHLLSGVREPLFRAIASPEDQYSKLIRELLDNLNVQQRVLPIASTKSMANSISALLSIRYGFRGPNETCVAACASGALAIARAYDSIASGKLDVALAGGTEYYGDRAGGVFMAFDRLNTLTTANGELAPINCPFDKRRSGFLFSQGAACVLVLERIDTASARKVTPICRMIASSVTSDAYSLVALSSEDNGIGLMIRSGLKASNLSVGEIDYINSHGTGTIQNDEIEAKIIQEIFGCTPFVNSTKSLLGHTIGACGAIEAAVTALTIQTGDLHPNLNLEIPLRDLNFVQKRSRARIRTGLTQNFGFGGHNVGLLFAEA